MDGLGGTDTPSVTAITNVPAWMMWPGRWGASTGFGMRPVGPPYQGFKWDSPALWALSEEQIPCRAGSAALLSRSGSRVSDSSSLSGQAASTTTPGLPPAPLVHAQLEGRKAVIGYKFKTFPTQRSRRPWMLITSVVPSNPRYAPYTVRTRIKARVGRVLQNLGSGPAPYRLRIAVLSAVGTRSKILEIPLK